ncbi:hypothetical protein PAXINDRAFT_18778, partial [Paxillus involutus ATCC 200175]
MGRPSALHPLWDSHIDHCRTPQISFWVEPVMEDSKPELTQKHKQRTPGRAISQPVSMADIASDPRVHKILLDAECFAPLLEKIQLFVSLSEGFAEIHPYVKAAWNIICIVAKIADGRRLVSHKVKALVEAMEDAHSFVSDSNKLERIESNRKILGALSEHTAECAHFIAAISKKTDFAMRILAPVIEAKTHSYLARFETFKASLQQRASIQAAGKVHEMAAFGDMRYTEHVDHNDVPSCDSLAPHLAEIVDEVTGWVDGKSQQRVYFLVGPESAGKTAVARKVSQIFDTRDQLGSSYFIREPHHANNIYRTISRDIAKRDAAFKHTLCDVIMEQEHLRNTSDVSMQFTELLLAPSQKMSTSRPILVVIDALNNCGNETSRVLEMLANRSMELPNNFRVLVTARPETDIVHAFQDKEH